MIDHIIKLKEFKELIDDYTLNYSNLRQCIKYKPVDKNGIYFDISIVLTIPSIDHIIEWENIHRTTIFFKDKGTKEQKDFLKWKNEIMKKIEEEFYPNIIQGCWIEEHKH